MLKGKDLDFIKEENFIYFDNILDGFSTYDSIEKYTDFESFKIFIRDMIEKSQDAYFDFYFSRLSKEEQDNILSKDSSYKDIIEKISLDKDDIFYSLKNLDDDILNFILDISFKEYLFSTFYFKNPDITIWTNYDKKYIIFYEKGIYYEEL